MEIQFYKQPHSDIADSLNNIALLCHHVGNYEASFYFFLNSLVVTKSLLQCSDKKNQKDNNNKDHSDSNDDSKVQEKSILFIEALQEYIAGLFDSPSQEEEIELDHLIDLSLGNT